MTDKATAGQGAPIFGAGVDNAPGDQAGGRAKEPRQIPPLGWNNRNILSCFVF